MPSSFIPVLLPSRGIFFLFYFFAARLWIKKKDTSRGSGADCHCIASIDAEVYFPKKNAVSKVPLVPFCFSPPNSLLCRVWRFINYNFICLLLYYYLPIHNTSLFIHYLHKIYPIHYFSLLNYKLFTCKVYCSNFFSKQVG